MAGAFKPVGVDSDSLFPPRVESRLNGTFAHLNSSQQLVVGATVIQGTIVKGDKGDKGDTGDTGPAGTITSATASPIPAGTPPTVALGGTASARTIAFGIPAGPKGDQGNPGSNGLSAFTYGTLPIVRYTSAGWPTRAASVPPGYSGPVEYWSAPYAGVASPTDSIDSDLWTRKAS